MASFKELVASDKPTLVDFHADWCGPCKTLAPYIQQVKQQMGNQIRVLKIDVDKNQQLAQSLQIQGVPTLMIFKKGELKWRQSGVIPANAMIEQLNRYL